MGSDGVGRILLLVDGSAASKAALRLAASVAQACSASVTAFSVVARSASRPDLEAALAEAAAELGRHDLAVETAIAQGDVVSAAVAKSAAGYDLAVFGARRRDRGEGRLESKLWRLAREIPLPVLLVPESAPPAISKILFCSGGERYIEKGARFAAALATGLKAGVLFLHVLPRTPELYLGRRREARTAAEFLAQPGNLPRHLRSQISAFESAGAACSFLLEEGDVREQIFQVARREKADLLVIGSAPARDALRVYALGNITRDIAVESPLALLIVRSEPGGLLRDFWRVLKEPGPDHW